MQIEIARSEAHRILDKLPEAKLIEALNCLRLLDQLLEDQLDAIEDLMENLGWSILASEVAKEEWQ